MPSYIYDFATQTYLALPAPWPVDRPPAVGEQRWTLVLGGNANVNFRGDSPADWKEDECLLEINAVPALSLSGRTPPAGFQLCMQVEQWSGLATINSIYDQGTAIEAGFVVDRFDIWYYGGQAIDEAGQAIPNAFRGLRVIVKARDSDAWVLQVGYQLTLLGRIVNGNVLATA